MLSAGTDPDAGKAGAQSGLAWVQQGRIAAEKAHHVKKVQLGIHLGWSDGCDTTNRRRGGCSGLTKESAK